MLGVLSLIFWSLFLVVTLKYVVLILRADNAGEGGILSLLALVQQKLGTSSVWATRLVALAALGTALFYCDALITPAISVLSAPSKASSCSIPTFAGMVLPITLGILVALFAIQSRGTARVGGHVRPDHGAVVRHAGRARRSRDRGRARGARPQCRRATPSRCSQPIRPSR